jgi:hypothetical protein
MKDYDSLRSAAEDKVQVRGRLTDTGRLRTAAANGGGRREIPDDFKYNTKKLKHLKGILHNVSVALGTLTAAFSEFSKFKGHDISPDGKLGGAGYILPLKDVKQSIQTAVQSLSDVADCIADELNNPRWEAKEDKEVKKLIKEKEEIVEKVEDEIIDPKDVSNAPQDVDDEDIDEPKTEEPEQAETPEEKPEPENPSEPQPEELKMASDNNIALAKAVQASLINFIEN